MARKPKCFKVAFRIKNLGIIELTCGILCQKNKENIQLGFNLVSSVQSYTRFTAPTGCNTKVKTAASERCRVRGAEINARF